MVPLATGQARAPVPTTFGGGIAAGATATLPTAGGSGAGDGGATGVGSALGQPRTSREHGSAGSDRAAARMSRVAGGQPPVRAAYPRDEVERKERSGIVIRPRRPSGSVAEGRWQEPARPPAATSVTTRETGGAWVSRRSRRGIGQYQRSPSLFNGARSRSSPRAGDSWPVRDLGRDDGSHPPREGQPSSPVATCSAGPQLGPRLIVLGECDPRQAASPGLRRGR